jgi:hypothetical protein
MYYHEGHKFVCGDNNGKYSVWSYEKYGNEKYGYFNIDLYSYYSIIGSWLHFTNCDIDIYVDEDAVDVFIPNEVELAEKDKWLIIRK